MAAAKLRLDRAPRNDNPRAEAEAEAAEDTRVCCTNCDTCTCWMCSSSGAACGCSRARTSALRSCANREAG